MNQFVGIFPHAVRSQHGSTSSGRLHASGKPPVARSGSRSGDLGGAKSRRLLDRLSSAG